MLSGYLEKFFRPLWAPETETGTADAGDAGGAPPADGGGGEQQPERTERKSVRQELEAGFDEHRRGDPDDRGDGRTRGGRFARDGAKAAKGQQAPEEGAGLGEAAAAPVEGEQPAAPDKGAAVVEPPAGWAKEAKAEWAKLPATVQAAVAKRETDVQRGVDELKARYADIDAALQPHVDEIRRHGHTPAQAVNQLFAWFQALAQNPQQAFPALANSFGFKLGAPQQKPAAADPKPQEEGAQTGDEEIPPGVQKYIDEVLRQQLGGAIAPIGQTLTQLQEHVRVQNEAKTNEVLAHWAKDKPHYERVRQTMAQLIASGAVPLKDGRVDLDGAYDKATWFHDDIRGEILAKQEADRVAAAKAAATKAATEQAKKLEDARRANVGLPPSAPGTNPATAARRGKKGQSVRESILAAKEELSA